MARQTKSKVKPFNLEDSPVVEENERILEQGKTPSQMEAEEQQKQGIASSVQKTTSSVQKNASSVQKNASSVQKTASSVQQAAEAAPVPLASKGGMITGMKPLKAEKGVKIALPMEYYFKLVQMKACTGKSLQDLAAQGVMEFIERYKNM